MATSIREATASSPITALTRLLKEIGLVTVYEAPLDTKLLLLQRLVRLFAYGGSSLVLVSYLSALGFTDTRIGLFMTLTLIGDVVISLVLSLVTDGLGRRRMLSLGSLLMTASGFMFAASENYWILLAAATIGIISPSGTEIGPFRAIEESTLSHLTSSEARTHIFAWYSMTGTMGLAFGMICCGWLESAFEARKQWARADAHRLVFLVYGGMGFLQFLLTTLLSRRCELHAEPRAPSCSEETTPLSSDREPELAGKTTSILPRVRSERRLLAVTLTLLFGLDAFATSLATLSWKADYFQRKFHLSAGHVGSLLFTTSIISTLSILLAASLARRFGNLNTMVYTHLPSAVALAFLGIPDSPSVAMALLVIQASSQYMESAPRSSFLAEILLPEERTAILGVIGVVKTGASSFGPMITGYLVERNLVWVAFVVAGFLKVLYAFGLLGSFFNYKDCAE